MQNGLFFLVLGEVKSWGEGMSLGGGWSHNFYWGFFGGGGGVQK